MLDMPSHRKSYSSLVARAVVFVGLTKHSYIFSVVCVPRITMYGACCILASHYLIAVLWLNIKENNHIKCNATLLLFSDFPGKYPFNTSRISGLEGGGVNITLLCMC